MNDGWMMGEWMGVWVDGWMDGWTGWCQYFMGLPVIP
jgi:hypothetical protein